MKKKKKKFTAYNYKFIFYKNSFLEFPKFSGIEKRYLKNMQTRHTVSLSHVGTNRTQRFCKVNWAVIVTYNNKTSLLLYALNLRIIVQTFQILHKKKYLKN